MARTAVAKAFTFGCWMQSLTPEAIDDSALVDELMVLALVVMKPLRIPDCC